MEALPMGIWVRSLARAGGIEGAQGSARRGRPTVPASPQAGRRRGRVAADIAGFVLARLGTALCRLGERLAPAAAAEAPRESRPIR